MKSYVVAALCVVMAGQVLADSPNDIFEQRIMPIFRSPQPSSCIQCHLASVDLKDYILPSAKDTFVSLRDQGLIDPDNPRESKILHLIQMGEADQDVSSQRIHKKARESELAAFAAWIQACCDDPAMLALPKLASNEVAKPAVSDVVIRHARKDRILDSFVRNVWSQRMRCFPCHTPGEIDDNNPQHKKPRERHTEFVKKFGQRMNLFRETPRETMNALIASSRNHSNRKHAAKTLPLINVENPKQSLLVLKPTAKVPAKQEDGTLGKPSSVIPVSHLGGLKMHNNDHSYKAFLAWIEDYAKIANGQYQSADQLPSDDWNPTQFVLRIKETPETFHPGNVVQLFLHIRSDDGDWDATPVAFTQTIVTPRRILNGSLFLLGESKNIAPRVEAWKHERDYLIKAYVDFDEQLAAEPTMLLHHGESDGQWTIKTAWQEGFKNAVILTAENQVSGK
ncbi:MAG: hypothetical protein HKN47_22905 [Pirellulaceae bacterium]|nr:hypothetical protein [Pirellulaceae bacterium]